MADKKISALTGATTPLAGTEVLPIVQGGSTVKVAVSDLTAGRDVSSLKLTPTDNVVISTSGKGLTTGGAYDLNFGTNNSVASAVLNTSGYFLVASTTSAGVGSARLQVGSGGPTSQILAKTSTGHLGLYATGVDVYQFYTAGGFLASGEAPADGATFTERTRIDTSGNFKVNTGNLIVGTAAKGIDFSANANAPGMTSELLTWYEEGTWTPNQGAGLTVIGAFSSSGSYTRIGRQVTIFGKVAGATSVACSTFGVICTNLPFNPAAFNGFLVGGSPTAIQPTVCSAGILYSINAVSAGSEINFVHTYFV